MLTTRQRNLLNFIVAEIARTGGVAPSFEEMQAHLGESSKSGVHRLVTPLERRGFISRIPGHARAIHVLKTPDAANPVQIGDAAALKAEVLDLRRLVAIQAETIRSLFAAQGAAA